MIVRINEFDLARAEAAAGWDRGPRRGAIVYEWLRGTHAYEILVLEQDEQGRPLSESFRQSQLRQLVAESVAAFREAGEQIVVRLDGALAEGELPAALDHLIRAGDPARFTVSGMAKPDPGPAEVVGSVRLQMPGRALSALLADPDLGLERSVRLRAFAVPESLVPLMLDLDETDDDRWNAALTETGFMLSTVRGLRSLQVITDRLDAPAVKSRLMRRLLEVAQGTASDVG